MMAGYLVACIGPNYESVHFYATWSDIPKDLDFGRVPQAYNVPGWNNEPVRGGTESVEQLENWGLDFHMLADNARKRNVPKVEMFDFLGGRKIDWYDWDSDYPAALRQSVHHARNLEVHGHLNQAVEAFRQASTSLVFQSFARDREELIEDGVSLATKGCKEYLRDSYLIAFGYDEQGTKAVEELKKLDADPKLHPHIAYILANEEANLHPENTGSAFEKVVNDYPNSSRAESAMMMVGRSHFSIHADRSEWEAGINILHLVLEKYPETRFRDNIEGWLGGYELKRNDVNAAITHYLRQSHSSNPREARKGEQELASIAIDAHRPTNAVCHLLVNRHNSVTPLPEIQCAKQIQSIIGSLSPKEAKLLQKQVSKDPILLQSYLAFRLSDTATTPKDERRLLEFASDAANGLKGLDKGFYARLAELDYRVGRYHDAVRHARMGRISTPNLSGRAMYVEGGALDRLGYHEEALKTFASLQKLPNLPAYLLTSVKEQSALLNEKYGDPVRAYELYRDIGHEDDLGFMVDNELSYSQIAKLISQSTKHQERSILKYSLAMRYFRDEKYDAAERTLRTLPTDLRLYHGVSGPTYVKALGYWEYQDKVPPPVDPLKDVTTMRRFREQAERARTQESRAKALYGLVQYTHSRRNLMYYSPGLWMGDRSSAYGLYWNKNFNKGHFQDLVVKGAFNQECDAQTLKFCKELIRRCPHSSYMPKALYTAGISAESLSRFNSFWRDIESGLSKVAARYMRRVVREYPHHPLAEPAAKYADVFASEDNLDY
ncbi:MAG: hypothetical protein JST51_08955 [Armatimonadetes bacterium]|nr:hypothetical protein [Armatimonadota bacterium]